MWLLSSLRKGYSYERVDGSVRGEERHLAIKNFGQQPIFVFLLSTRAGKPMGVEEADSHPTTGTFSPNSLKGEVLTKEY